MIDLHAHAVLEPVLGTAGSLGPELDDGDVATDRPPCFRVGQYRLEGVRYRGTPFMDPTRRLAEMDAAGIRLQVLSPNPLTFFSHADVAVAAEFARHHNDAMAELVDHAPTRLRGFAQLPTQDPELAVAELRRAVEDLGLLGAYLNTDLGRPIDDPAHDQLWAAAVALDVPVLLHPAPSGIDGPRRDDRLDRFDADLWLGFLYEETLAVASLVLGGVLERFPTLDVCISHGGGAASWLAERMAHAAATRPWGRSAGIDVAAALGRLWWDAHVGGPNALDQLVGTFGTDRVVAGTNLAGWDQCHDPSHGDARLSGHFDANARRLLRLDR